LLPIQDIKTQITKNELMTYERAVAQIILARVLDLRYKDGKDNN
jgi:hypothetical protein